MIVLAVFILFFALIPAMVFCVNLRLYRRPEHSSANDLPRVSVLIPARNEEKSIRAAVESALASEGVDLEVVVMDDQSEDGTANIVQEISEKDARVRLVSAPPLPSGWCGKQHACWQLSREARHPILAFLDADVRLTPDGLARAVTFLKSSGAALVSGVPKQETGTLLEKLILPLIHFILLGFLPMSRMRRSPHPSYAAGCGQLFVTDRDSYEKVGGHSAIRESLHDGLTLPRAYRTSGLMTDLFDATDVATCRMYRSAGDLWQGLVKNSTEGLGNPKMIVPITILMLGGQVLPMVMLGLVLGGWSPGAIPVILLSIAPVLNYLPRVIGVVRFRQSLLGALVHPLGVTLLMAIQWHGLLRLVFGRSTSWKGRAYPLVSQAGSE